MKAVEKARQCLAFYQCRQVRPKRASQDGEAPPVGLILCAEKDEAVAHYALGGLSNKVFASRYQMELPDPDLLRREIEAERQRLETRV